MKDKYRVSAGRGGNDAGRQKDAKCHVVTTGKKAGFTQAASGACHIQSPKAHASQRARTHPQKFLVLNTPLCGDCAQGSKAVKEGERGKKSPLYLLIHITLQNGGERNRTRNPTSRKECD